MYLCDCQWVVQEVHPNEDIQVKSVEQDQLCDEDRGSLKVDGLPGIVAEIVDM